MTKSQIFTAAWTIARREAVKTSVSVRRLFGAALRQAWAAAKAPARIVRTFHAHGGRAWIAAITGRDAKFGLARSFLAKRDVTDSGNVYRDIEIAVEACEGAVYEWSCQASARRTERGFWIVAGGKLVAADRRAVEAVIA